MSLKTELETFATHLGAKDKDISVKAFGDADRAVGLANLTTTAKANLVAAINELVSGKTDAGHTHDAADIVSGFIAVMRLGTGTPTTSTFLRGDGSWATVPGGVLIDDDVAAIDSVYSSAKTEAEIAAAIAALVDSAPGVLDTLAEIAAALGDDPNFATTVTTALGNRLRFDAPQTLSAAEQTQGQTNLGLGDLAVMDLVGTYDAAAA